LAAILVYMVILGVLPDDAHMFDRADFLGDDPAALVIAVAAVLIGITSTALGSLLPRWAARWQRHRVGRLFAVQVVCWALFQVVAIFGVVLGVLGGGWAMALPFFVACVAAHVLTFPTEAKWRRMLG